MKDTNSQIGQGKKDCPCPDFKGPTKAFEAERKSDIAKKKSQRGKK